MIRLDIIADDGLVDVQVERRVPDWSIYLSTVKSCGGRVARKGKSWRTTVSYGRSAELESALRAIGLPVSIGPGLGKTRDATEELRRSVTPLYPFQELGAEHLRRRSRGLLFDQQGLGKTAQALTAIVRLGGPPALVVCPAHLRRVWQSEAKKFAPGLTLTIVKSGLMPRWPVPGEVLVVSYESLPPTIAERTIGHVLEELFHWFRLLLQMPKLNVVPGYPLSYWPEDLLLIGDELHYCKEPKARRTRRWRDVGGCAKRIWGLTGTPLLKHPPDLWQVLNNVGIVWQVFGSWEHFSEICGGRHVREQVGRFKIIEHTIWDGPVSPAAAEALKPYCLRRLRVDVLPELPEKTVEVLTEDRMGPKLVKRLDEVWAVLRAAKADHEGQDEADWMPNLEGMSEARSMMALAKLPLVEELLSDIEGPVVLWSAHVAVLTKFAAGRDGWATITGHDSFKARDEAVRAFQAGELKGLACSIKAAGTGLTLTASSRAVFVDLDWQEASNVQAQDRQVRIGQRNAVLVTIIELDHPLDRRVSEVCLRKAKMAEEILGDAR